MAEKQNPNFLPHILVITGDTADEREYEIGHPEGCPVVCPWWPGAREGTAKARAALEAGGVVLDPSWTVSYTMRTCYVEHEVGNVGLESLDLGDAPYAPSLGSDQWRQLSSGRYVIEGWYEEGRWYGSEYSDPDGGLRLLGKEETVNA